MNLPHWSTAFREADGSVSCSRVVLIGGLTIILGTWAGICIAHHQQIAADHKMIDLPWGLVTVVGICAGVKVGRQFGESDAPPADPPQS